MTPAGELQVLPRKSRLHGSTDRPDNTTAAQWGALQKLHSDLHLDLWQFPTRSTQAEVEDAWCGPEDHRRYRRARLQELPRDPETGNCSKSGHYIYIYIHQHRFRIFGSRIIYSTEICEVVVAICPSIPNYAQRPVRIRIGYSVFELELVVLWWQPFYLCFSLSTCALRRGRRRCWMFANFRGSHQLSAQWLTTFNVAAGAQHMRGCVVAYRGEAVFSLSLYGPPPYSAGASLLAYVDHSSSARPDRGPLRRLYAFAEILVDHSGGLS